MTGYPVIHSVRTFRDNAILPKIFPHAHNTKSLVPNDPINVSVICCSRNSRNSFFFTLENKKENKRQETLAQTIMSHATYARLFTGVVLGRTLQITGKAV